MARIVDRLTTSTPDYGCFIYHLATTDTEVRNATRSRPTTAIKVELWEIPPHLGKEIFNLTINMQEIYFPKFHFLPRIGLLPCYV